MISMGKGVSPRKLEALPMGIQAPRLAVVGLVEVSNADVDAAKGLIEYHFRLVDGLMEVGFWNLSSRMEMPGPKHGVATK